MGVFQNPLYDGADPWIIRENGFYYSSWSDGKNIFIGRSENLITRGTTMPIWSAPEHEAWNRAEVWAPEIWKIRGRWYLYYAADAGKNESHRMGVLEAADPFGPWEDRGVLYTGDRWAIDGTVLEHGGKLYFIWSGWPGSVDGQQNLYIAPMDSPVSITAEPVLLSEPTLDWERVEMPIHEGPEILKHGNRTFIVYSASGSWTPDYCLGALYLPSGDDPLVRENWMKVPYPLFSRTKTVFGPGHASFTTSPDGKEDWIIYHAKKAATPGWARNVRAQKFTWNGLGFPEFGSPVPAGSPQELPSGS